MAADYDYREGKRRVDEILNRSEDNSIREKVPNEKDFHFDNGYYCWITSIFVDIRDSTKLFNGKKPTVSKIIRSFTSEVIEILNTGSNMKEIGIRGDCVYGVFSTPQKSDVYEVMEKAVYVNTLIKMLNAIFDRKNMDQLKVGIGVATSQDLIVKAGREGSGINDKVWIGEAVTAASNLSFYGNKNKYTSEPILISPTTYVNIKEKYGNNLIEWFTPVKFDGIQAYACDLVNASMNNWIEQGMID